MLKKLTAGEQADLALPKWAISPYDLIPIAATFAGVILSLVVPVALVEDALNRFWPTLALGTVKDPAELVGIVAGGSCLILFTLAFSGRIMRWLTDRELPAEAAVTCEACGEQVQTADTKVSCSCASSEVKARIGHCIGVYYCTGCFEGLRREDGTLPPEWSF